jgi:leader peptidase (prepilin peptidase)/N-methyltransferase
MSPAAGGALAFVWGLVIGSFVTVVAYRVPRGESIVQPRSRCPGCGAQIAAYDNIPVVSWAMLRGRSRCCGERISVRYPLIELGLGGLYAAIVSVFWGDATEIALGLVFVTALVAVTVTDLDLRLIPNKILIVAAVLGVAIAAIGDPSSLPERAAAAAAASGLLFLAALAYPHGMGLGDVKLAAVMGLFLGRNVAPALLVALLAGSIVGLAMIAREGGQARKRAIPFGPFLALGSVVALFAGDQMVDWYLGAFF